jgi:hypothetical protein
MLASSQPAEPSHAGAKKPPQVRQDHPQVVSDAAQQGMHSASGDFTMGQIEKTGLHEVSIGMQHRSAEITEHLARTTA